MPEAEDGAKAARELLQLRNFVDRVVRRADDRAAEFGHALRRFVAVRERMSLRAAEDAHDVLVLPSLEAVSDFAQRLLLGVREMERDDDAPLAPINGMPELFRRDL